MNEQILIQTVSLPDGAKTDIRIFQGVITEIGNLKEEKSEKVINGKGLLALPGLVDLHTHLREPGGEDSETIETGSRAAAAGGIPNTSIRIAATLHKNVLQGIRI